MRRQIAIQQVRKNLQSGGISVGSWMQIPHPSVAEIMGQSGYDWVAIDMEHGSIAHHQLPDLCRALELGNTLPLARIVEGTSKECKQSLDAGCGGVIVPMVETGSQLSAVRNACRWPPSGTRGVGFSRANLFGQHFGSYQDEAQSPLLIAMIEHCRAVQNLDEILVVEGLDAILIGPYDLSASMGLTAQFEHPDFHGAMIQILEKAKQRKVAAGIHVVQPSKQELSQRIAEGYQFLAYSIDAVMLSTTAKQN
ncbi:HpcH/HpaI aldolase family protein [Cylindrospermopsis raciborskii]|uniref:2,4-dihydroxyhept-2-ene-1,7-dioic acid aldolase n=1 Tax=Cylindrospermopsis raciborskii CENA302 TaxID=1170768 RepID=A0A9Q5QYU9_9CYAN|nr:aldolase/citrate lyase family protein [Cylindrospermopsis raciborskii]OPH11094.1 2,4-dihydroxyhept-2-ene-1,7-dioic acid aldolase [Cylindrospermopsis raciborskii CENA302]